MENFRRNDNQGSWNGPRKFGGKKPWERGGFGGGDRPRPVLHKATCVECGNACEVPFKPNGSKPVFCRDCFKKQDGGSEQRSFSGGDRGARPSFGEKKLFGAVCDTCGNDCEVPFRPDGSKPVYCRSCFGKGGDRGSQPQQRSAAPDNGGLKALDTKLDAILAALNRLAPAAPAAKPAVKAEEAAPKHALSKAEGKAEKPAAKAEAAAPKKAAKKPASKKKQ